MSDTHVRDDRTRHPDVGDPIASFAGRVLDVLVDRSRRTTSTLRADLVLSLAEGMVTQDEARIESTLAAFRRGCISPAAMADTYVPAAAAHLGAQWVADRMSFADVTIATARLQALVRAIGTRWGGDPTHVPGRRSILMVVPGAEDHTLGAIVATGQLRRTGLSVCLRIGPSALELRALLRSRVFDAAMVSIGHAGCVEGARRLVDGLRVFGPDRLPIIGGGAALFSGIDLPACTGVDFATADVGEALSYCRFEESLPVPRAHAAVALSLMQ